MRELNLSKIDTHGDEALVTGGSSSFQSTFGFEHYPIPLECLFNLDTSSSFLEELQDDIRCRRFQKSGFLPLFSKFGQLFTVYYLLSKSSAGGGMLLTLFHSSVVIASKLHGIGLNFSEIDRREKVRFFARLEQSKRHKESKDDSDTRITIEKHRRTADDDVVNRV